MDEVRIAPAGDPFTAAPHHDDKDHPHACNDGWVTLGQIVVDPETGEEREEFALYLCRRCAERSYGVESTARAGVSFEAPALDHEERKK